MYRTDFWTLWEKARVGYLERRALKHVYYQGWNRSPAQVECMRQVLRAGALGRPRVFGWRGRWVGWSGWGTHVNPWLIHVNVWKKALQYCKAISLQLIKLNGKKKDTPWKESYDQPRQHIKKQRHYFVNKGLSSEGYGFSSGHVWMWELDYKESWVLKNWCFWIVVLERLLSVPWTARRSNQSILKEISPGCSLEGLILKLKLQYFRHLMQRDDSFDPDFGKDWRQDEMAGWHHRLDGHEFG